MIEPEMVLVDLADSAALAEVLLNTPSRRY
jgi:hypothetical protein